MRRTSALQRMGLPLVLSLLIWGVLTGCGGATSGRPGHLSYTLPTVTTVRAGETLPGTGVRYDRMNDRGAYLVIGGQRALKRGGDSVTWESSPVSSTTVDLSLRVVWYTENEVNLAGTAKINVEGVEPRTGVVVAEAPIRYTGPVTYRVKRGATIPGSTLVYTGPSEEGARLEGIDGYALRRAGDSLLWEGFLREDVQSRLELRVIRYDEEYLDVGGLVTLWIGH